MISLYLGVWCFTLILWALRSHFVLASASSRERRDEWTGLLLSSRADMARVIHGFSFQTAAKPALGAPARP
jgi:hypothetical protein